MSSSLLKLTQFTFQSYLAPQPLIDKQGMALYTNQQGGNAVADNCVCGRERGTVDGMSRLLRRNASCVHTPRRHRARGLSWRFHSRTTAGSVF